ncbi:MAG: CapA family protein [Thermoleophilaceae bacterium]
MGNVGKWGAGAALIAVLALGVLAGRDVAHHVRAHGPRHHAAAAAQRRASLLRRSVVSIAWVGDMSLSRKLGLPPASGAGPLEPVRRRLQDADLALGNLEGTLGSGGGSKCGHRSKDCFAFQAPASYAGMYARAGFDVLNLANNHAADFGPAGEARTLAALYGAGVGAAGPPGHVELRSVRGVRVALLGFAPYPWAASLTDIPKAIELVRRAAARADLVIVMMHAGAEGTDRIHTPIGRETAFGEDRGDTRRFAHAVVDAGADLVVGSGPHVLRGVERRRGRLIAYSLGNFLGFNTFERGGVLSLSGILRVELDGTGALRGARWISIRLTGPGTPAIDRSRRAAKLVSSLSRADFGAAAMTVTGDSRLVPAPGPPHRRG